MNKTEKLSKKLIAWFSARRKVQDWIDNAIHVSPDHADSEDFLALRNHSYDLEWELINLGMRQSVWEEALEQAEASEEEWSMAMELRESIAGIEPLSPSAANVRTGMTMGGWWFLPVAMDTSNETDALFGNVLTQLQQKFQTSIRDMADMERESTGLNLVFSMQLTPFLSSEGLRENLPPPGNFDSWPMQDRQALALRPTSNIGLMSACVGVYLAAPDYRALATVRDLVSSQWNQDLPSLTTAKVKYGDMGARATSLGEAELLRWELWGMRVLEAPLEDGAVSRHVVIMVERKNGKPVKAYGHSGDHTEDESEIASSNEECKLDGNHGLLHDMLLAFMGNTRQEVSWSVHTYEADVSSDSDAPR